MKASRYNYFIHRNQRVYLYNQISEALIEIDHDLYSHLVSASQAVSLPEDIEGALKDICAIVEDELEESTLIRLANLRSRYSSDTLRVTILPTLACNFKCWYCYETHKSSHMTTEGVNATLNFIKNEALSRGKKYIILDWFGGEPLLYFETIIYPLSLQLLEWCSDVGITLHNMITTNGSLITVDNSQKMKEIGLNQFQITLDGDRTEHNKVRYSAVIADSYSLIVGNIETLVHYNQSANIDLRLNYTPENVGSLGSILEDFPERIRGNIRISPHVVWQKSDCVEAYAKTIHELLERAEDMGYKSRNNGIRKRCTSCYTENADQYVVNYDLCVYKCTARDYDSSYSIGRISPLGVFHPNSLYYKYLTTDSPFINSKCLQCEILPSCLRATGCLQKALEGNCGACCNPLIKQELDSYLTRKIEQYEKLH